MNGMIKKIWIGLMLGLGLLAMVKVNAATLTLGAPALVFPSQTVGMEGAPLTVTLTAVGGPITFHALGTNSPNFTLLDDCGTLLSVAASPCTLHIKYTPVQAGTRYAELVIRSDATNPDLIADTQACAAAFCNKSIYLQGTAIAAVTTPNAFTFVDQAGSALSTLATSAAIAVAGINAAAAISVVGGEYSISNGAYTAAAGTVTNGQTVTVQHTTSASNSTATNTTLTIGGVSDTFTTTTLAPPLDTIPNAFTFVDQTGSALSTLTESAAITVAGINAAAAISVVGGEYSINNGAYTAVAGTVTNNQTVKVRHTTSASNLMATNTTLTIGGVSDTFTTTTLAPPGTTPNQFTFVDQTGSALSTLTESAAITVAGINAAATISVVGGEYSINNGAYTAVAGTVTNNQTVKVRHTTSASNSTATNTTLTIGGVSDTFTTTTLAVPVAAGGLVCDTSKTRNSVASKTQTIMAGSAKAYSMTMPTGATYINVQYPTVNVAISISAIPCDFTSPPPKCMSAGNISPGIYASPTDTRMCVLPALPVGQYYYFNVRTAIRDANGNLVETCPAGAQCTFMPG